MGGITVTYWHNGNRLREYHANATSQRLDGEFQLLLDAKGRILASYRPAQVVCIEEHAARKGEGE